MNYRQSRQKKRPVGYLLLGLVLIVVVVAFGGYFLWKGQEIETESDVIRQTSIENDAESEKELLNKELVDGRKSLFDRNMQHLAISFPLISAYLRPLEMKEATQNVTDLANLLDLNVDELQKELKSERSFVWLKKNIDQKIAQQIADLHYDGVYLVRDMQRVFPEGKQASHVIGFVKEEQGLAGSEFFYDSVLRGDLAHTSSDLSSVGINMSDISDRGSSVVLTIDLALQRYLEKKLQQLLTELNGKSAMAAVINTSNGELLALTNQPSYDPNIYWQYDSFERRNRIVTDPLPVGGFSKFFIAALEIANGNLPKALLFPEEIADRIISPRNLKQWRTAKKKSVIDWQAVSDDAYLYPTVSWPEKSMLTTRQQNEYCLELGLDLKKRVDLPGSMNKKSADEGNETCVLADPASVTTGINLLTAYGKMVNGGTEFVPHVLGGLWLDAQSKFLKAKFPSDGEVYRPDVSSNYVRFIKSLRRVPERDLVIESVVVHKDEAEGVEVERKGGNEVESETLPLARFDVITLAADAPKGNMAAIVVVEGAVLDLEGDSPLKKAAKGLLRKARKLNVSNPEPSTKESRLTPESINKVWENIHQKKVLKSRFSKIVQSDKMPEVIGLSLRKALRILQDYRLQVKVQGSGTVVSQYPVPGAKIKDGAECQLKLSRTAYQ